ncbi:conserved hypothetical protein [Vibrio chagasii]|nr:conserved hypothetical protein [Vibrio chagasii]
MTLKIITHSGSFHADELFATALIKRFVSKSVEVIRTRDEAILTAATQDPNVWVVDVGRSYNEKRRNFDHHQASFSKTWPKTDIPYSSCGLVWSYLRKKGFIDKKLSPIALETIEKKLIKPIDKHDNRYAAWPQSIIFKLANRNNNTIEDFLGALAIAEKHLEDTIYYAQQLELNLERVDTETVKMIEDGMVAIVDDEIHNIINPLVNKTSAKIIIMPKKADGTWSVRSVASDKDNVLAPEEWRGLSGSDLQLKSGLSGLVFVHKSGFLTISRNKKDAVSVARRMLEFSDI